MIGTVAKKGILYDMLEQNTEHETWNFKRLPMRDVKVIEDEGLLQPK